MRLTVRDLYTKLRQLVRGPPPLSCGECGAEVQRKGETFHYACGHSGEIVMHARAKVTGISKAFASTKPPPGL